MRSLPLRTRLMLVHLLVILLLLALAAVIGRWSLSKAVNSQLDAALLALAETEAATLAGTPGPVRVHEAPPSTAAPSLVRLDRLVQIVNAQGQVLARSANLGTAQLPVSADLPASLAADAPVFQTLANFGEEPVRMVLLPVRRQNERFAVQVAGSLDDARHVVAAASTLFLVLTVALLAAVGLTGTLLTRRVFHTIETLVQQAKQISSANLGERLPNVGGGGGEIAALIDTLNDMLARLEHGFEAQKHFTADASHELRSPLSRLRAELEVCLRRTRSPEEYQETLRSCLDEVARLTQLLEELLLMARLDASQERLAADRVLLPQVTQEVMTRLEPLAHAQQVQLRLAPAPALSARVTREHLRLVLSNLLDNAIKFSPPGAQVMVQIEAQAASALIRVLDQGPGIAEQDLPHLFDRFYRGSESHRRSLPGTGLGLSLSQSLIAAQGGQIRASNTGSGACFTVCLPLERAD